MADDGNPATGGNRDRGTLSLLCPWRLSWVALVLFVLYITIVSGALYPVKLLDPEWQLGVFSALVNTAGFPLVGLGLLHLAADLAPGNRDLASRRRLCARLAVPVTFGFLLMVPLQSFSLWHQSQLLLDRGGARIAQSEATIAALRQALQSARSAQDIQLRLQELNRPLLSPAELALPLPTLRRQAETSLQQAEQVLARQRRGLPQGGLWAMVQISFRNTMGCLALAIGFAALAQRQHSRMPLLQEWLHSFKQARMKSYWRQIVKPKRRKG
jgi:hypothetical protein